MIIERIMKHCGFNGIWISRLPNNPRVVPKRLWRAYCYVGLWVGPGEYQLCVVDCFLWEDIQRFISPPGRSIFQAAVKAWWKRRKALKAGVVFGAVNPVEIAKFVEAVRLQRGVEEK